MRKLMGLMMCVVVYTPISAGCDSGQPQLLAPLFDGCKTQDCGLNGAWIGQGVRFRMLHMLPKTGGPSAANRQQIKITEFKSSADDHLDMDVIKDELIGTMGASRQDLTNATITLEGPIDNCIDDSCNGEVDTYQLKIIEILHPSFWTACSSAVPSDPVCMSAPPSTPAYRFEVTSVLHPHPKDLCQFGLSDDTSLAGTAVIFIGDIYDDANGVDVKSVDGGAGHEIETTEQDVFNIACYGTAVSKLHFLRHTAASSIPPGYVTTNAQRKALLQLLAGDYCGDGHSFTEYAHPIRLDFNQPKFDPQFSDVGLENAVSVDAMWSADGTGASCVDLPRLSDIGSKGGILSDIQACKPNIATSCDPQLINKFGTGLEPQDFGTNYAISANLFLVGMP